MDIDNYHSRITSLTKVGAPSKTYLRRILRSGGTLPTHITVKVRYGSEVPKEGWRIAFSSTDHSILDGNFSIYSVDLNSPTSLSELLDRLSTINSVVGVMKIDVVGEPAYQSI